MAATEFIAAIELGSTEITGIAGKKNADGSIQVLAYAAEHSSDCIKKGAIYNLDKTTQSLTSVIKELEKQLQASIKKVYVGVGGQSVRSIRNTVSKQLGEETKISQALVDSLMQSNKEVPLIDQEILAVEVQEYKVGNSLLTEPVGVSTNFIEGRYLNIIGRHTLKSNIKQCFRLAGYEIADYLLSPLVTANAVLNENEIRSGCALVDLGADTTTVSVYKNKILRHLAVIPLGSSNITKDICSQQIEEEDAEQLKLHYGKACIEAADSEEEDVDQEYTVEGKYSVRASVLDDIIEARVTEIIDNVWNQIKLSTYNDKLMAGIILTGGGSNLPDIEKAFRRTTKIDKIRIARSGQIAVSGGIALREDGTQNTLVGLLAAGKDNCCKVDPHKQINMFDQQEEDKKKEELLKDQMKRAEEENKRRADEARQKLLLLQKEQQEKERAQKRLDECNKYLSEAARLKKEKSYREALEQVDLARAMRISEKMAEIDQMEESIKADKKENKWFSRFREKMLREIWDDDSTKK